MRTSKGTVIIDMATYNFLVSGTASVRARCNVAAETAEEAEAVVQGLVDSGELRFRIDEVDVEDIELLTSYGEDEDDN